MTRPRGTLHRTLSSPGPQGNVRPARPAGNRQPGARGTRQPSHFLCKSNHRTVTDQDSTTMRMHEAFPPEKRPPPLSSALHPPHRESQQPSQP